MYVDWKIFGMPSICGCNCIHKWTSYNFVCTNMNIPYILGQTRQVSWYPLTSEQINMKRLCRELCKFSRVTWIEQELWCVLLKSSKHMCVLMSQNLTLQSDKPPLTYWHKGLWLIKEHISLWLLHACAGFWKSGSRDIVCVGLYPCFLGYRARTCRPYPTMKSDIATIKTG